MLILLYLGFALWCSGVLAYVARYRVAAAGLDVERHDHACMTALDGGSGGAAPPRDRVLIVAVIRDPSTRALVRGWLLRLGIPRRDVDDSVQEVLLQAYRSADRYSLDVAEPERWLNGVTLHVASHYHEKVRRRLRREELTAEPPEFPDEGADAVLLAIAAEEERRALHAALAGLPAEQASLVRGHDIEEQPMAELAREIGVPGSTAYKWRGRALAALGDALRAVIRPTRA